MPLFIPKNATMFFRSIIALLLGLLRMPTSFAQLRGKGLRRSVLDAFPRLGISPPRHSFLTPVTAAASD